MPDAMDDVPTVWERLGAAEREVERLKHKARETYGGDGRVTLHDTPEQALAYRMECARTIDRLTKERDAAVAAFIACGTNVLGLGRRTATVMAWRSIDAWAKKPDEAAALAVRPEGA